MSAYETSQDLQNEAAVLRRLGCEVLQYQGDFPELHGVQILVVTSKERVGADLMDLGKQLELVITTTSGHDHIDLQAAEDRQIAVVRCPIARRDAVVDTSMAMGLSLLRDLPALHDRARAGIWARGELPGRRMGLCRELDVGVIGYGVIGRRATEAWRNIGARVRWHDPAIRGSLPLADLFELSRVVTLHCSLTPTSECILDGAAFAAMAPGTLVINTARGRCIDLEAILEAEHLGGIGLDVFPDEPWPDLADLAARPRTIVTPHAAGYHPNLGAEISREVQVAVGAHLEQGPVPHRLV
jgi:phosphoglycerate dehydrogenase-like enzyme